MICLQIDALPPRQLRLNGRKRSHWSAQTRKDMEGWMLLARVAMETNTRLIPERPWEKAQCHVHFIFPDNRRRDLDNYFAGVKEVIDDFIIGWGVIPDDSFQHLEYRISGEMQRGLSRTIVHIHHKDEAYKE